MKVPDRFVRLGAEGYVGQRLNEISEVDYEIARSILQPVLDDIEQNILREYKNNQSTWNAALAVALNIVVDGEGILPSEQETVANVLTKVNLLVQEVKSLREELGTTYSAELVGKKVRWWNR